MVAAALWAVVSAVFIAAATSRSDTRDSRKEIAVTFDQLPVASSFDSVDCAEVTRRLLDALQKHEVPSAGFVVGDQIGGWYDLLGQWLNGGHVLGNLTYSHQDFNEMGIEQFIRDIAAGGSALEPMLAGFGQKTRYFRYPYLHYGTTVEAKREVKRYLDAHEVTVVHATVVVEDYLYNLSFERMGQPPDSGAYTALKHEYITHVLDEIDRCERLAQEILKRPCRQILLLRANRLNAEFLADLLLVIKHTGYKFVPVDYALQDDLYAAEEAYFNLRGVGYLDMLRQSNPDLLPAE